MANPEPVGASGIRNAKADPLKRIVAGIIDGVIAFAVGFVPIIGGLAAAGYWLFRDGLDFEFMDHRSLGKKVMKLRPVGANGQPVDLMGSAKRNWIFALGGVVQLLLFVPILGWIVGLLIGFVALGLGLVELILIITDGQGRRLGDRMAGTVVEEVAEPVAYAA